MKPNCAQNLFLMKAPEFAAPEPNLYSGLCLPGGSLFSENTTSSSALSLLIK